MISCPRQSDFPYSDCCGVATGRYRPSERRFRMHLTLEEQHHAEAATVESWRGESGSSRAVQLPPNGNSSIPSAASKRFRKGQKCGPKNRRTWRTQRRSVDSTRSTTTRRARPKNERACLRASAPRNAPTDARKPAGRQCRAAVSCGSRAAEQLDDFPIEGRDIVGLTARDEIDYRPPLPRPPNRPPSSEYPF